MAVYYTERVEQPYRKATSHTITIRGEKIDYEAVAEDHIIAGEDGGKAYSIFTFSYLRQNAPKDRPVLFFFNGGPGASSAWLHLGFYGPRLLSMGPEGLPPREGPYTLRDNPDCLLDLCDLVAVDPVNAGYSRLFDNSRQKECFGDYPDALSVSKAIRLWTAQYGRAASPKYFSGESFGSTRASLLAWLLRDLKPIGGEIHIGPGYSGKLDISRNFKDLPPLAAANWYYHPQGKGSLDSWMEECRRFLYGEYARAWNLGSQCPEELYRAAAGELSRLTGLPEEHFRERGLWVSRTYFREHFLEKEGLELGSFDIRFTLPAGSGKEPFMAAFDPPVESVRQEYFTRELELEPGRVYRASALDDADVYEWDFTAQADLTGGNMLERLEKSLAKNPDSCPGEALGMALANELAYRENPSMRFFFGTGRYDSVATVENTRFGVTHTDIPMKAVTMKEYESGHAVYGDERSRERLARDIREFLLAGVADRDAEGVGKDRISEGREEGHA